MGNEIMELKESALAILRNARDMIDDSSSWIQGPIAEDEQGNEVAPYSESACAWCAYGALHGALNAMFPNFKDFANPRYSREINVATLAEQRLENAIEYLTGGAFNRVTWFNDDKETEHADVLDAFNGAIDELERGN